MSFHQCTEMFVQLNVLCLGNWLRPPLRKKCGEVLVFSIFHPTRLFRPTQLLIWMNLPPYTIIPHCTAIRHFTVVKLRSACIMYKAHKKLLPNNLQLLISLDSDRSHITRQNNTFKQVFARTTLKSQCRGRPWRYSVIPSTPDFPAQ